MTFAEAVLAMTLNLFFEARGEGERGMQAVADVTITRVEDKRYPNNIQDVVLQRRQFSWTHTKLKPSERNLQGLMSMQRHILHSGKFKSKDIEAYRRAEKVARKTLQAGYKPRIKFTHFHNTKVNPSWAKYKGQWIGKHIFYRM